MTQKDDRKIQAAVDKLLVRDITRDRSRFSEEVDRLVERFGDELYPRLLFTMAHLEFQKRTARKHWKEILRHWEGMRGCVGREIDVRVALLDYFVDINRRIKNPKIIEIKIFQKTQQQTHIDELTQLFNYRYFISVLKQEVRRSDRYHAPLSLVIFDADDFKHYNDTNGHLSGNKALRKLARILKGCVRDVDIVARYGGEEFVMVLPETDKEGGMVIAERVRRKVESTPFIREARQPLKSFTVSAGVATFKVDAVTDTDLIKKADQALYRAKARGKNQVCLYEDERRDFVRVEAFLTGRLQLSSDSGEVLQIRNLSEGGLLFTHDRPLPIDTILRLSFQLPGRKTPVSCKARVKRIEEMEKGKHYEIGARITHIPDRDRRALKRFVSRCKQKEHTSDL